MSKLDSLRIYRIWKSMKQRCSNPKRINYKHYGGRGISVCESWNKFENFYRDMGEPPTIGHTLDRINSDGNYEKSNCRWVTRIQQRVNSRVSSSNKTGFKGVSKNHKKYSARITIHGKTKQLGSFKSPADAANAYNSAAQELFGIFAKLNIIK